MNKKISNIYLVVLAAFVTAVAAISVTAGLRGPQNANSSTTTNSSQEIVSDQVDLSGTYTGTIKITGSHEMSGEGTITISGSTVTIEAGGMTHTGRIFAVTTRGYTGVTMYFPDVEDSATKTGLVLMARAKKKGEHLMLTPVPGARNTIWFKS